MKTSKQKRLLAAFSLGLLLGQEILASDDHDHESFREGQAIMAVDHDRGFRLSDVAAKNLGLKAVKVESTAGALRVPRSALVFFQGEVGVYRWRTGWYKLLDVEVVAKDKDFASILGKGLVPGDAVVSEGVALLRVADLEASGGADEGHGH